MIVLRNHFNGNPTILIAGRIINGCQDFAIGDAPRVFDLHDVPTDVRREVLDLSVQDTGSEDYTVDDDYRILVAVARHGNDDQRTSLITSHCYIVRHTIAKHGNDEHRTVLLQDDDRCIRCTVAQYGNDDHRTALLHDSSTVVRANVARYGNDAHRAALWQDSNELVREAIRSPRNKQATGL